MAEEAAEQEESQVNEETEFEAAFDEIAAAKEGGPTDPDNPMTGDDPKDEEQAKDGAAEAGEGEEGKTGDDAAAADKKTGADDNPDKEPDYYEGLSDAAKAHFKAIEDNAANLQHRIDSDAGRVSAFQRKINGMEKEIQAIRKGGTAGQQPSMDQITNAMKGTDEDWQQFSEDYPQIASVIDKRMAQAGEATQEAVNQTLAPVVDNQNEIRTDAATTAAEKRVAAVAETYPTWTEEVQTPAFQSWLDQQPPGVMALADSDDTADASTLIGLYDQHLVASGKPSLKADPTEPGVDGNQEEETPEGSEKSELDKKREQQLEDGVSAASKSAGVNADGEAPDEFEAAFNAFAARKERARATA